MNVDRSYDFAYLYYYIIKYIYRPNWEKNKFEMVFCDFKPNGHLR